MSVPHAKVIVNPIAGGYLVSREWPRISRQLRDISLTFDHVFTEGPGHAIEIAKQAADSGYHYLIAVGGDGTVNEVVNGILYSANSERVTLGIVSSGTACGLARSLNISQDYVSACSLLAGQRRAIIDVGVAQCWSQDRLVQRFFVNVADVGFGAAIVDAWKNLPKRFGHRINYTLRTVEGLRRLLTYRNKGVRLSVENEVEVISSCAVIVANGHYLAENIQIAPHARLDDGLLDVVIVGDVNKSELLKIWPALYSGNHITHPKIKQRKTRAITVESYEQLLVEVDGDVLGESPASFWILPSALTVVV